MSAAEQAWERRGQAEGQGVSHFVTHSPTHPSNLYCKPSVRRSAGYPKMKIFKIQSVPP